MSTIRKAWFEIELPVNETRTLQLLRNAVKLGLKVRGENEKAFSPDTDWIHWRAFEISLPNPEGGPALHIRGTVAPTANGSAIVARPVRRDAWRAQWLTAGFAAASLALGIAGFGVLDIPEGVWSQLSALAGVGAICTYSMERMAAHDAATACQMQLETALGPEAQWRPAPGTRAMHLKEGGYNDEPSSDFLSAA